jgi:TetR/AcrR family transcriptional regulator, copper-responsive repressor
MFKGLLNVLVQNQILGVMGRPRKFSREGVLQKALPVFWKYGFARTTLPDLEVATGVNKSGLYSEFENKEELFLACLRYYLQTRTGGAILSAEPLGWDNIQKFLEEAPSCAFDQRGCFSVNSMREVSGLPPEARKIIVEGRAKLKRLLKANIAAENPKMDVDVVCDLLSVFFSGICIEANLNADRSRAREKIENFMQMLRAA